MDSILFFFLGLYQCNPTTMQNGFGKQCIEIIEVYTPRPLFLPSKFGAIPMGMTCDEGIIKDGHCEKRYLTTRE